MKKVHLVIALMCILTSVRGSSDLFEIDYDDLVVNFEFLNELENYIHENPGITYSDLSKENHVLIEGVTNQSVIHNLREGDSSNFIFFLVGCIGGVLGGCILGLGAVLIVHLITDDSDSTKQTFFGCVVGTAITVVLVISLGLYE